jgi:hypothetical protein
MNFPRLRVGFLENSARTVNLSPAPFVYQMSAAQMTSGEVEFSSRADQENGTMARNHANFWGKQTPASAQAERPRRALAAYPLRQ